MELVGASTDARHVFFVTDRRLVGEDRDHSLDIYSRTRGKAFLESAGQSRASRHNVWFAGASSDGRRVFFSTIDQLTRSDRDRGIDIYERYRGHTTLVSSGPVARAKFPAEQARVRAIRDGGSTVFFETDKRLTADDPDAHELSLYRWHAGHAAWISNAHFAGASANGRHVFFGIRENDDYHYDWLFDEYDGVSEGLNVPVMLDAVSPDGSAIVFSTRAALSPADADTCRDVYIRSNGINTLVSSGPGSGGDENAHFEGASTDLAHIFFSSHE
ncbi:MAG: hypothetical protein QOG09_476, partial [Solirubrobacterales bacterium]|nr:hypothetical protein [Solirubrobacterales bacterium]